MALALTWMPGGFQWTRGSLSRAIRTPFGSSADERVMVDREVALNFKDTSTKTRIFEEITAPYLDAVKTVAEVPG